MTKWLKWLAIPAVIIGGLSVAIIQATGELGLRGTMMKQALPTDYFEPYTALPAKMVQHTERVYSYRLGMNRSLILRTDDGLAVFDCFDEEFSASLAAALDERFPGEPVRWLVYSHNHLDHIRGGAPLVPEQVIGHADVNLLVADFEHPLNPVLQVTRSVTGDETLTFGGINVEFLFMPQSHSLTMFGIHIPSESAVFAPDMMFVEAMPPFGFPDWYYPGYIRALDRLIALNADHYVPSHFDLGTRDDLIAYRTMMSDYRELVVRELAKRDFEAASGKEVRAIFEVAYPELKAKYGDWHGFEAMFVPHFAGQVGGTYLGF